MSVFKLFREDKIATKSKSYTASYEQQELLEAMERGLLQNVVSKLTKIIVKQITPEVLKALDKELIVKEVSLKVSEEILQGIYGKLGDKKDA